MTNTRTIFLDNFPDEKNKSLKEFLKGIDAPVSYIDSPEGADVVIDWPEGREICEAEKLHGGGRISCPDAFKAGARLRIDRGHMGDLLNLLDIRIFGCQLGCFK
jgi:hypothetical protein